MRTCEYDGAPFTEPRSHPWVTSTRDPDARYYDLRRTPALIRTSLEDFVPWSRYSAIEAFYVLVEELNREASDLESNDSAFVGPHACAHPAPGSALECSGRVMIFFRALERNVEHEGVARLTYALHVALAEIDRGFTAGIIGTTIVPVRYLAFSDPRAQLGAQLMISFWAFGDTEADTMQNLGRLVANLSVGLRTLS